MNLEACKYTDQQIYQAYKDGKEPKMIALLTGVLEHEIIRIINEQINLQ
jgi:hypothetical protein